MNKNKILSKNKWYKFNRNKSKYEIQENKSNFD